MNKYQRLLDLGMVDVTTPRQEKNGTRMFKLDIAPRPVTFGLYASGYVRNVDGGYTCYQLNPIKKIKTYQETRTIVEETGEVLYTFTRGHWDQNKRILIKTEEERIEFLANYIERNYQPVFIRKSDLKGLRNGDKYFRTHAADEWERRRRQISEVRGYGDY